MPPVEPAAWQPPGVGPVVFSASQIQQRVAELGTQISTDHAGQELVLVGVLKGTLLFLSDLLRALTVPAMVDFMAISRFGPSRETGGAARLVKDLDISLLGRHVLLVEDIVDTGLTLSYLMRTLKTRHPASLEVCALLNRPRRRMIDVPLRYVGFEAPDEFIIGYGLHVEERFRQLPYIAVYRPPERAGDHQVH
jgi:hypoxanthine phosphoribosyltransferase